MAAERAAKRKPRDPAAAQELPVDSGVELPEAPHPRRPNAPGLRCLARAHAAAAVEALAAVMRDPTATPAARVSAAGALLAWGYGKAGQSEAGSKVRTGDQIVRLIWGGDDA